MFKDRFEAGHALVGRLSAYAGHDAVVLAVNRGGVGVASPIARSLRATLDVVVTRPIYANGGLLLGSLCMGGGRSIDDQLARSAGLAIPELAERSERARRALAAPSTALRGVRPFPEVADRIVIVVSDGLGPAHDLIAALRSVRARGPRWLVGVAPFFTRETARRITAETDLVVTAFLGEPPGSIYEDVHRADDEEAHRLLAEAPPG
jgi:putative phosphoribosyl transferase